MFSLWPIDRNLSGATTPGQSGPGRDGNKELFDIPQSSSKASPSDYLVSYPEHSLGKSYSSVKMQSLYFADPVDWACGVIAQFEFLTTLHVYLWGYYITHTYQRTDNHDTTNRSWYLPQFELLWSCDIRAINSHAPKYCKTFDYNPNQLNRLFYLLS